MPDIEGYRFRIHDLSRLDQSALKPLLEGKDSKFEEPAVSSTGHSELATLALIGAIGMLGTVASYYFGKYRKKQLLMEIEIIDPQGGTKRITVQLDETSIDPVDNQILKQIKDFLGDPS
jgi:LPXTG-motif cell wall-anchored protein